MKRKVMVQCIGVLLVGFLCFQFVSCMPKDRTQIRFWHSYTGAQAEVFTKMVAEYNRTQGKDRGVTVLAYYKAPVEELSRNLTKVSLDKLPNIMQVSDEAACLAYLSGRIVGAEDYLSDEALSKYVFGFLESGRFTLGGDTYIFPVQSTLDVLYLNAGLFDEFRKENSQFHVGDLRTWDGIYEVAKDYYTWSEGHSFIAIENFGDYLMIVSKQHASSIIQSSGKGVRIVLNYETLEDIWQFAYGGALRGYVSTSGNSLNRQMEQEQVVCYVASTESARWVSDTYQTLEGENKPLSLQIRQYPSVTTSYVVVPHHTSGVVVVNQDSTLNAEAYSFLDWMNQHELAYQFCTEGKSLPVHQDLLQNTQLQMKVSDTNVRSTSTVAASVYAEACSQAAFLNTYHSTVFYGSESFIAEVGDSLQRAIQDGLLQVSELMREGYTQEDAISMTDTEDAFQRWIDTLESIQLRYSAAH